jgi:hypothetical protein
MEGGRGSTATGGLSGTVALARSIVTHSAPCLCRCMGSSTPCCATTAALLVGGGLWSSCVRLLLQDLLGSRAIPIPAGCALIVGDALEPLACATLGVGMQGGMVHREQVRRWCRRIRGHRERCSSGNIRGLCILSGTRRSPVCSSRRTARMHPHEISAYRPVWDGLVADRRLVSPSPRVPRPAAPPPRLWSAPSGA